MFVYDYRIRNHLHVLRPGGRLNVLMALALHANPRNRCFPSQRLLAKETGHSVATVNRAIAWLKLHGCIEVLDYNQRIDDEIGLPIRQNIYQMTGVMKIDGEEIPYMYSAGKDFKQAEIEDEANAAIAEVIPSEISPSKILPAITKVNTPISKSKEKEFVPPAQTPESDQPKQKPDYDWKGIVKAVNEGIGIYGAEQHHIANMLLGRSTKEPYSDYNLSEPATPDEISRFGLWMKRNHPDISIRKPKTIESYFLQYRAESKPKPEPQVFIYTPPSPSIAMTAWLPEPPEKAS